MIVTFPSREVRSLAMLDAAWRDACCAYLFACFGGASVAQLQAAADEVLSASFTLQKRRSRQRLEIDSLTANQSVKSPLSTGHPTGRP
jgi:hypothetical protein